MHIDCVCIDLHNLQVMGFIANPILCALGKVREVASRFTMLKKSQWHLKEENNHTLFLVEMCL